MCIYIRVDQHSSWQYYVHIQKGACSYGGPLCVAENIMCFCLYYALTVAGMNMCIYMYVYIHVHNVCNIHMYM